jgi:hypothetical protein
MGFDRDQWHDIVRTTETDGRQFQSIKAYGTQWFYVFYEK